MSGDGHPASTDYRIAPAVLEAIVRGALAGDARLRVPAPGVLLRSKTVEVTVEGALARVTLPLEARFGQVLPALGAEAQQRVAEVLGRTTGLTVEAVEVQFVAVLPPEGAES